jgi:hypothetical protein
MSTPLKPPTPTLLGAAVAGLLAAPGCDPQAADDGPRVLSSVEDRSVTFASFSADCDARGGLVQTHATCAGTNSCRGVSFNKFDFVLTEHTCRALNTCGGLSCVVLPEDAGRGGAALYGEFCAGCHGGDGSDGEKPFAVFVPRGGDADAAVARFVTGPIEPLVTRVAFGIVGVNENGTAASNMPGYHLQLSVAEIERLLAYLRAERVPEVSEFGTLGVDEEVDPGTP